jgi:hypothetical protein
LEFNKIKEKMKMKKYILLTLLTIIATLTLNCGKPLPSNAFRVRTRGKIHLFGIPLGFSVPNPNIPINLKTTTTAGTAGTTGNVGEWAAGGAFVATDGGGRFDAVNAIMPAPWTAKVAPNQSLCTNSPTITFGAVNQGVYNLNCKWNITVTFLVQPTVLDLSGTSAGSPQVSGTSAKSFGSEARFTNSENLKVRYYKQVSGEDYIYEGETPVTSTSPDGTEIFFQPPNYYDNNGLVHYLLLVVEDGNTYDPFVGYGEMDVIYPLEEPTPTPCPPDRVSLCG